MKPFFVYILRCNDGSYYVGHADDLETRMAQHATGALGGYTAARRPLTLVWVSEAQTRDEAFRFEMLMKGWSRAKKEALIRADWDGVRALAAPRTGPDLRRPLVVPLSVSKGHHERRDTPANGHLTSARPEPVEGRAVARDAGQGPSDA